MLDLKAITSNTSLFENSFTLVDISLPHQPLIHVNDRFCELTGYRREDILGKNCRFLQGSETNRQDVKKISLAIKQRNAIFCDLLNYRKDGTSFFNRLALLPILIENSTYYIGLQTESDKLKKSFLDDFDLHKKSEDIKDLINTPLMKLYTYLSPKSLIEESQKREKTRTVLQEIYKKIVAL